MKSLFLMVATGYLVSASFLVQPAAATDGAGAPPNPCQAQRDHSGHDGTSLSSRLDACNGVLRPPGVGDREFVEPPPPVGNTPVIPPGSLREEQG